VSAESEYTKFFGRIDLFRGFYDDLYHIPKNGYFKENSIFLKEKFVFDADFCCLYFEYVMLNENIS